MNEDLKPPVVVPALDLPASQSQHSRVAGHPQFPSAELESVCQVLARTEVRLTGAEIGRLLQQLGIADPAPDLTHSNFPSS